MNLRLPRAHTRPPSASTANEDGAAVDAAIARVLAAEASARDECEQAEREAEALLHEARRDARLIAERAERRVRFARERFEASVQREVARIAAQAAAFDVSSPLGDDERARAGRAAVDVAAELTGSLP